MAGAGLGAETDEQRELAGALGIPVQARVPLLTEAWSRLLDEIGGGESTTTLGALTEAGFVTVDTEEDQALAPTSLTGMELVTGTDSDLRGSDHIVRMARMAAEQGLATVVGEAYRQGRTAPIGVSREPRPGRRRAGHHGEHRGHPRPGCRAVAAVLTIAIGPEVVGHYGYGAGAQAVLPESLTG